MGSFALQPDLLIVSLQAQLTDTMYNTAGRVWATGVLLTLSQWDGWYAVRDSALWVAVGLWLSCIGTVRMPDKRSPVRARRRSGADKSCWQRQAWVLASSR
jgi:hypothetical protein